MDRFWESNLAGSPLGLSIPDPNKIFRSHQRSLPTQPPQPLLQQSQPPNIVINQAPQMPAGVFPGNPVYELTFAIKFPLDQPTLHTWTVSPSLASTAKPFAQYDWPIPTPAYRIEQTWARSYNLNLIGKDRLPAGEQVYDLVLSQRPPEQIQLHSWTWNYNLSLIGKDQLPTGDQLYDLTPSQRPPEQVQLHVWTWSYNLNLIGQDRFPPGGIITDRPTLPVPPAATWIDTLKLNLAPSKPFAQYDWPNPTPPSRLDQTWARGYNLNLIGQDQLPVGEIIYTRPQLAVDPPPPTWIDTIKYSLIAKPFAQTDWPNPVQPYRIDQTWARGYNLNLIGKDQLPAGAIITALAPSQVPPEQVQLHSWQWWYNLNLIGQDKLPTGQQVFDLAPRPALRVQEILNWVQTVNLALITPAAVLPFNQFDWPLSAAWSPTLLQTWVTGMTALLLPPPSPLPPGVRSGMLTARTAPAMLGPADLYSIAANGMPNLLPPPFVPPGPPGVFTVSGTDVSCDYGVSGIYTRFGFSNVVYPHAPVVQRTG